MKPKQHSQLFLHTDRVLIIICIQRYSAHNYSKTSRLRSQLFLDTGKTLTITFIYTAFTINLWQGKVPVLIILLTHCAKLLEKQINCMLNEGTNLMACIILLPILDALYDFFCNSTDTVGLFYTFFLDTVPLRNQRTEEMKNRQFK
jgi:hypothetical protein